MSNNNGRTNTSTQIRTMYSENTSCMTIKFYNTNLSFSLYPFTGKNQQGRSTYDMKNGQQTTVNYEGAYALYQAAKDIIDGKVQQTSLAVPCNGASLTLERKLGMNGQMETVFSISKNNVTIPFKFNTIQQQVNINGQVQTNIIEIGLGAFLKTIDGYLTGINADRHLNKLTEDYAKLQERNEQPQAQNQGQNNGGGNNNYRPRKQYNNYYQKPQQNYQTQSFSDYQIN